MLIIPIISILVSMILSAIWVYLIDKNKKKDKNNEDSRN
jgi:hypothetical protein